MAFLIDRFAGGLAAGRVPPRRDAATGSEPVGGDTGSVAVLRRLAQGRQARLALRAGAMALAGGAVLWGALAGAEAMLARPRAAGSALAELRVPPAWSEVIRPIPIYDLGGTDFAKLPRGYRARRHAPDGAREDTMSFGTPGDDKPYLSVALERRGDGPLPSGSVALAEALARVAGTAGDRVTQLRPQPPIGTRFGALERADLTLWRGGVSVACSGFRATPNGGDVLTLSGLACRATDRPLPDNAVACAVDRIDLLSAGDDRPLRALFVAAERRPGAADCGEGVLASSVAPAAAPGPFAAMRRRAAWLEAGSEGPPLRGPIYATDDKR